MFCVILLTTGPLRPRLMCLRSGSGPTGPMSPRGPRGPGGPLSPLSPLCPGSPGCPGEATHVPIKYFGRNYIELKEQTMLGTEFTLTIFLFKYTVLLKVIQLLFTDYSLKCNLITFENILF